MTLITARVIAIHETGVALLCTAAIAVVCGGCTRSRAEHTETTTVVAPPPPPPPRGRTPTIDAGTLDEPAKARDAAPTWTDTELAPLLAEARSRWGKDARVTPLPGTGAAIVETPAAIALLGRTSWMICRAPPPAADEVTPTAHPTPPTKLPGDSLPRYRNPPEIASFVVPIETPGGDATSPVCQPMPSLRFIVKVTGAPNRSKLWHLRDPAGAPSVVLTGMLCEARHVMNVVCPRVSLVFDLVDGRWTRAATSPERPDQGKDYDGDGRLEFPRTAFYFGTRDSDAALFDTFVIDAPALEAWDGADFSMNAPGLNQAYHAGDGYGGLDPDSLHRLVNSARGGKCTEKNWVRAVETAIGEYEKDPADGDGGFLMGESRISVPRESAASSTLDNLKQTVPLFGTLQADCDSALEDKLRQEIDTNLYKVLLAIPPAR